MNEQFKRTELLIGEEGIQKLESAKVAVFGIGGVGGYAVEALARSGVGHFVLIDSDTVDISNLNRQIIATHKTLGQYKVDAMKERILEINPQAEVEVHRCFYLPETAGNFDFSEYDYVIDAVDTVTAKLEIIEQARKHQVPVISSMGAGNKIDPTRFEVSDIHKTSVCPLAKVIRQECRKRGIKKLKVVYSKETPIRPHVSSDASTGPVDSTEKEFGTKKRSIPGSIAFVPSVAGLILAGEVIKDLVGVS